MARMVAAKTSLMVRKDALGEEEGDSELGIEIRAKLERRIKNLEECQVCISVINLVIMPAFVQFALCLTDNSCV